MDVTTCLAIGSRDSISATRNSTPVPANDLPQRIRDRIGFQSARGDLIEQRLEGEIVVSVQQEDFEPSGIEPERRFDARETTAQDQHPFLVGRLLKHRKFGFFSHLGKCPAGHWEALS